MTHYYQMECPRCRGFGVVRHRLVFERPCPACCGAGTIADYHKPIKMMPQPEAELTIVRPKKTAELLANAVPLGRKPITALQNPHRYPVHADTAALLGEAYGPVAGKPFHLDEVDTPPPHDEFVDGAAPERKNFMARMRQR